MQQKELLPEKLLPSGKPLILIDETVSVSRTKNLLHVWLLVTSETGYRAPGTVQGRIALLVTSESSIAREALALKQQQ